MGQQLRSINWIFNLNIFFYWQITCNYNNNCKETKICTRLLLIKIFT